MHYNWVVLVKAKDKIEAEQEAEQVMERIDKDNVAGIWDYFSIGGRFKEKSNIVNAKGKTFWKWLKDAKDAQERELKFAVECLYRELEKEGLTLEEWIINPINDKDSLCMVAYYLKKIAKYRNGDYQSCSFLATSGEVWGSARVPEEVVEKIKANPAEYWLVNIDIHN